MVNAFLSNTALPAIVAASRAASPVGSPGMLWLQVYIFRQRDVVARAVQQARTLGFTAICVTVDHPTTRITDLFVPRFAASTELPDLQLPNLAPDWRPGQPLPVDHDDGLTWEDLQWLVSLSDLPVVVSVARVYD